MRGLIVLVVFLAIGVLLLASGGNGGSDKDTGKTTSGPTTTGDLSVATTAPDDTTTTSPGTTRPPADVKVIVLNGSGQNGAAGSTSETIGQAGYSMQTPGNAPSTAETTVYYDTDYKAEGTAIALLLGKNTDSVKPLSDASLGGAEGDANVVVVLGANTPPVSSSTTTTTAAN